VTLALELSGVTSGYGSSPVVHGVSLQIAPGEILALVGRNGMGKTSLLKTILAFLPAWQGAVHIDGRDVTAGTGPVPGSQRPRQPAARA
jgi:ABC-type branched-subunit amino acid transport system ATPase component